MGSFSSSIKSSYHCVVDVVVVALCYIITAYFVFGCVEKDAAKVEKGAVAVKAPVLSPSVEYKPTEALSTDWSGDQDASTGGWNIGAIQVNGTAPILLVGIIGLIVVWWYRKKSKVKGKIGDLLIEMIEEGGGTVKDIRLKALARGIEPQLNKRVHAIRKKLKKEAMSYERRAEKPQQRRAEKPQS